MINIKNIPKPGVYYDIPSEIYFKWNCFSKSMVSATMKSAKHLKQYLENDYKSKAMVHGSLVDAFLLDESELEKYVILPDSYENAKGKLMPFTLRSNSCRLMKEEIIKECKYPVTNEEYQAAKVNADSVLINPAAKELLDSGKKQVSIVWDDKETGVRCKGRIDCLNKLSIDDLKTARDISTRNFSRDLTNLGYHIQAAMYLDGWSTINNCDNLQWNMIVTENTEPFDTVVYNLNPDGIECGRINYRMALQKYKNYLNNDPEFAQGFSNYIEPIDVPQWAKEIAYMEGENVGI